MTLRSLALIVLMPLLVSGAFGGLQEPESKLPIEVPKQASVILEAEGSGKEILKTVKHMLSGNMADPTAPPVDKITIKTGLGSVDIKVDDLAPMFEKVYVLHFVSYTALPKDDPFNYFEKQFANAGLKRVAFVPGPNGALITRHIGKFDSYGIVVRQKDSIVVLRTEGAPGLGDLGRFLFEALSRGVQGAVKRGEAGRGERGVLE